LNSIGAGAVLSLAAATAVIAGGPAASPEWAALIKAVIFPIGLILIIMANLSLFTGNIYSYGACVANGCNIWQAIGLLVISWFGNLIGSIWVAYGVRISIPGFDLHALEQVANVKVLIPYPQLFVLAIFCNMLVCYAVSMARRNTGVLKLFGIFFPIFLFVFFGFEHSIADMFYMLFTEDFSAQNYLAFLGIATAGNIIGGVLVTGFDYYREELV
jgi:formate/nitrite transporter FocA (FNT family)